jgi:ferredoxin-NADP reductase
MPADPAQKVAFLAGGVGITPFHSMIRHTEASKDSRDITLVYSVAKESEFAYRQLFDKLDKDNIRVIYSTDRLDGAKLKQAVNDYKERKFYVSGPLPFVAAMQAQLAQLGVASSQIATDYFPGYGG